MEYFLQGVHRALKPSAASGRGSEAKAQQRAPLGIRKGGCAAADYSELWGGALRGEIMPRLIPLESKYVLPRILACGMPAGLPAP